MLEGRLYRYRTSPAALQAFESPAAHAFTRFVIYVGGLTDGLLACPYVDSLAAECARRRWALVQPIISSSYAGFGTGSVARDAAELSELAEHLRVARGATALALVGHSTGCQAHATRLRGRERGGRRPSRACAGRGGAAQLVPTALSPPHARRRSAGPPRHVIMPRVRARTRDPHVAGARVRHRGCGA